MGRAGRTKAALAELRDAQLRAAQPGVERALPVAVAVAPQLRRALVPPGADEAFQVGAHKELKHGLGDGAQEVGLAGRPQQR